MSKLSDYSKFDHIDSDVEDDDDSEQQQQQQQQKPEIIDDKPLHRQQQRLAVNTGGRMIAADSSNHRRYIFEYNGTKIYEWEQSLEEVVIYVPTPPIVLHAKDIRCIIEPKHIRLGLIHQPPNQNVLNHLLGGTIKPSESTWSLEDNDDDNSSNSSSSNAKVVILYLTKSAKGEVWSSALIHDDITPINSNGTTNTSKSKRTTASAIELDEFSKQKVQQELMLERFQQENPGMDFRNAEFNGSAPDPRTFMGGINYE